MLSRRPDICKVVVLDHRAGERGHRYGSGSGPRLIGMLASIPDMVVVVVEVRSTALAVEEEPFQ